MQEEQWALRVSQKMASGALCLLLLRWVKHRTEFRDSQLRRESGSLHLEANIPDAFWMLALAGFLWFLLYVCTCGTAMLLAARGLTVAARIFALLRGGHKRSLYPDAPLLVWRLCTSLLDLHTMQFCSSSHEVECIQLTSWSAVPDKRINSTARVRD
jgi:hypothetical protein